MALSTGAGGAAAPTGTQEPRTMLRRKIPSASDGESIPVIGMGTWNTFDVGGSSAERAPLERVLEVFYAAGARLIDSSPMYGNAESVTGELVQQLGKQSATFYATKVWTTGRDKGLSQIEHSLRVMKTPRLDLLQIHNLVDWRTHAATLRELKSEGKIRYAGITHYTVGAHDEIESVLRAQPFEFAQFNYSIGTRAAEQRLLPYCRERGVAVLINRPFEEGALFTRVRDRKLPGYAAELGCTSWAQLFLKFIVAHPAVTCVIPATSRAEHMQDNLQAGFGPMPDAALRERMAQEFDSSR
ncbi:MAG TPA: aldo/keto reductase [Steroidobacteraceae bacterium]|nr:aldo/keto reductase [Steroidobacteraceae bacterium]